MTDKQTTPNPETNHHKKSGFRETMEWVVTIAGALLLAWLINHFVIQMYMVDGHSMDPTLANNERIVVNKLIYEARKPTYGEIVVFIAPPNPTQDFIKRVIGLPNDIIEVKNHVLYRNGVEVKEPYINAQMVSDFPATKVPANSIFVMGDNRNHSEDSRMFGAVPLKNVIGRADVVLFPFANFEFFPWLHNQKPVPGGD